ncbi:MAG: hypothetical protein ACTSPN_04850 [Promethearchaeota archaeon]
MEDIAPERKIVRMEQVFAVGGTYNDPSDFTRAINKNLLILRDSDKNCDVKDIKFNVFTDQRYTSSSPIYLAFIIAEVDVDITPEPEIKKKKRKKRKKKKE